MARARQSVPGLRALVVGEGYERPRLEAKIKAVGGTSWIDLAGHVSDDDLADAYRTAWVLASTSLREGWNMTITEAGACGTPAVVSDIAGHRDALTHGVSGLLVDPGDEFVDALVRVLTDAALRESLAGGAVARARNLTWDATAATVLGALVEEAEARAVAGRGAPSHWRRAPAHELHDGVGPEEHDRHPHQLVGRLELRRPRARGEKCWLAWCTRM